MEEFGCCKQRDYVGKRGQVLQALNDAADVHGFAGTMVWQVRARSGFGPACSCVQPLGG
jgi:hypothetical protein